MAHGQSSPRKALATSYRRQVIADRRTKRLRTRTAQKRQSIKEHTA